KYVAFVRGELKKMKGEIKIPISDFHEQKFRKQAKTKSAITRYQVTAIRKGFSVVDVFPETGRTNQIRIHFSKIGHPLLGERVYAFRKDFAVNFRRLALHAAEIRWQHPVSKKKIKVEAELPEDMREFLKK
ncbi:MAG: RNA pseudouridine synthase, partial [Gammaproteobacteria bacterium]|nr:RNA pseudouridine synthase [Gammaproteobacteria bacterium]